MASIAQSFDVKIKIIRPFFTRDISAEDLSKINQTTNLKYETPKSTAPQANLDEDSAPTDSDVMTFLEKSVADLQALHDDFDDLAKKAEEALNKIVYTYDITLPTNELIANAERSLFGSASGVITLAKYKKVLAFEEIINREIQERMVENGGVLDVVA